MNKALMSTEDLICEVDRFSFMTGEIGVIPKSMIHDMLMSSIGHSNRVVRLRGLKATRHESRAGFVMVKIATSSSSHIFGIVDTRTGNNCLLGLSQDPTRLQTLYKTQPLTIAGKDDITQYMRRCKAVSGAYIAAQKESACQVGMLETIKNLKSETKEMFSRVPVSHQQLGRVYTVLQPMGVPKQKAKGQTLFRLITEMLVIKCATVTAISLYDYNSRRVMTTLDYALTNKMAAFSCLAMLK